MQNWLESNSSGRTESPLRVKGPPSSLRVPGISGFDLVVCFEANLSDLNLVSVSHTQNRLSYLPAMGNHMVLLSFGSWKIGHVFPSWSNFHFHEAHSALSLGCAVWSLREHHVCPLVT